jgi:hypothetical protein
MSATQLSFSTELFLIDLFNKQYIRLDNLGNKLVNKLILSSFIFGIGFGIGYNVLFRGKKSRKPKNQNYNVDSDGDSVLVS